MGGASPGLADAPVERFRRGRTCLKGSIESWGPKWCTPTCGSRSSSDQLKDGTVKQLNPFSGTEVWTVAGRGNRPLGVVLPDPVPLDPALHGRHCPFCEARYLDTPPEKSRVVHHEDGTWETRSSSTLAGEGSAVIRNQSAEADAFVQLLLKTPDRRRRGQSSRPKPRALVSVVLLLIDCAAAWFGGAPVVP